MSQRLLRTTFLLAASGSLFGCALKIPAPTVTRIEASSALSPRALCPAAPAVSHFTVDASQPLTAALECSPRGATFVVFNAYQVRVRTIQVAADGSINDERSYLCPDSTPALETLLAVQAAVAAPPGQPSALGVQRVDSPR